MPRQKKRRWKLPAVLIVLPILAAVSIGCCATQKHRRPDPAPTAYVVTPAPSVHESTVKQRAAHAADLYRDCKAICPKGTQAALMFTTCACLPKREVTVR